MKPMAAHEIRGNWPSLLLPIREDESIDYGQLERDLDTLTGMGVDGIYSNGSAGEFHMQTEAEFERIHELLADRCRARQVPFQIGASHMSPVISLERIRRAARWKPSAIQVILADWIALRHDDEIIDCLQRFAEAADGIGLVLYNPPHAKRVLRPQSYALLKERVPSLVGVKTAGGDEAWYEDMRKYMQGLSVFVPGHLLATGISLGAHGAYSNVACLHPLGAQRWYNLTQSDLPAALQLEQRIRMFMSQYIEPFITERQYCNAACDKLMAAIGGWSGVSTRLRRPYRSIPAAEAERLRPIAHELLPEIFV